MILDGTTNPASHTGEEEDDGGFTAWANDPSTADRQRRRQQEISTSSTESQQGRRITAVRAMRENAGPDNRDTRRERTPTDMEEEESESKLTLPCNKICTMFDTV